MLLNLFGKSKDRPNGQLAMDQAEGEAVQQYLAKQTKLQTAHEAVLVRHHQEIASEDVEDVRRLKAKHLGEQWRKADSQANMGDIIVCDDYHHNDQPERNRSNVLRTLAPWLLGVSLAGATGFGIGTLASLLKPANDGGTVNTTNREGFLLKLGGPEK